MLFAVHAYRMLIQACNVMLWPFPGENGLGGAACSQSPCGGGLVPFGADQACVAPQPRISAPDGLSVPMDAGVGFHVAMINASIFPPSERGLVTFSIAGWEVVALGADRTGADTGADTGGSGTSPIVVTLVDASTPTPGVTKALLQVAAAPLAQNSAALLISVRATFSYRGVSNTTSVILRISIIDLADDRSGGDSSSDGSGGGNSGRSSNKDKDESAGIPGYFIAFAALAATFLVGIVGFCCCARTCSPSDGSDEHPEKDSAVFDNPSFAGRPPITVPPASGHDDSGSQPSGSQQNPTYAAATLPVVYDHASTTTPTTGTTVNNSLTSPVVGTAVYDTASPAVFRSAAGTPVYDTASNRSVQPPATVYDMATASTGKGDGDDGYLVVQGASRAKQLPVVYDKAVNRVPTYDRATAGGGGQWARPVLRAATATYDEASSTTLGGHDTTVYDKASSSTPVSSATARSRQKNRIRRGERDGSLYEGFNEENATTEA